ncbi:hypothetical protein NLU13_6001 [Sarocladium strictum]|uniref:Uncharacterized protein n=1 Tax=Sarocladium strictum TaxID=5046 RepID=A0AA39L704_SARSR|nr:hypothetical protein NLU13_6001 [Sarocladium strictum]
MSSNADQEHPPAQSRKRTRDDPGHEMQGRKRQKTFRQPSESVETIDLVSDNDEKAVRRTKEQAVPKRESHPADEDGEHQDEEKTKQVSKEHKKHIEIVDLTRDSPEPATAPPEQHTSRTGSKPASVPNFEKDNPAATQFELARRHFTKHGTADVREDGLPKDVIRALRLVRRLEKEANESPEDAMKRMRNKTRSKIKELSRGSLKSSSGDTAGQPWILPNRLDAFVDKDDADDDKWSEGDEAATQDVTRKPGSCTGPKRRRRIPWLEQCGWDKAEVYDKIVDMQAEKFEAAKLGINKDLWEQYKIDHPNWKEEEAEKAVKLREQRQLKCKQLAKERAFKRRGTLQKAEEKASAESRKLKRAQMGKEARLGAREPEAPEKLEAQDAAEPEGNFDLDDWDFSDGDVAEDEAEKEGE